MKTDSNLLSTYNIINFNEKVQWKKGQIKSPDIKTKSYILFDKFC